MTEILESDWLTTGPAVDKFENEICAYTGAAYGVAVSNGTSALHCAMHALGIEKGDEVIVPAMTFAATANCVFYQGGKPVFADVNPDTLLIDPSSVEALITTRTKAIIGVDYAGQACDWEDLRSIASRHHLALVADSCHALGGAYKNKKVGTLADITVFSFHPVKQMTTGEGGMAVTDSPSHASAMRLFRNHGITTTSHQREKNNAWQYDMTGLGYNYRITDLQCALGSSQLKKLDLWLTQREELAGKYDAQFAGTHITPLKNNTSGRHAWHLYVVKVSGRDQVFRHMRQAGIGVNVHYRPVYLHPYYQQLGYSPGLCPNAEEAYREILTLPLWPGMSEGDVFRVSRELFNSQMEIQCDP